MQSSKEMKADELKKEIKCKKFAAQMQQRRLNLRKGISKDSEGLFLSIIDERYRDKRIREDFAHEKLDATA